MTPATDQAGRVGQDDGLHVALPFGEHVEDAVVLFLPMAVAPAVVGARMLRGAADPAPIVTAAAAAA